jgi:hypothetical protein
MPETAKAGDAQEFGVGHDQAAAGAQAPEVTLVDRMDIHVHCVGFPHGADDVVGAQHGRQLQRFRIVEHADRRGEHASRLERPVQRGPLVVPADQQHAARGQYRVFGEARRRGAIVEGPAADGQGTNRGVAVGLRIEGGRAASGVISRLAFALDQHDAAGGREFEGCRGSGDPAADDQEVAGGHGPPSGVRHYGLLEGA